MEGRDDELEEVALKVTGLRKKYRSFELKEISFELQQGFILGLVGRNGAGKTTLMKSLINPQFADGGDIFLDGIHAMKDPHSLKKQIGVLMEEAPFLFSKTLAENGELLGAFYDTFSMEAFLSYLKRFELYSGSLYAELSKGMRMKFQLAFALAHKPKLLLMDEATGGLDVVFRKEFFYLLQEAVEQELLSVIIATHVTEDLDKIADYVACIEDGSLKFCRSKEELYEEYREYLRKSGASEFSTGRGAARLEDIIYRYDAMQKQRKEGQTV
ncbi:MAG: ATP-binding cassette domain-containing protein [Lachnospiraceae bacterium]